MERNLKINRNIDHPEFNPDLYKYEKGAGIIANFNTYFIILKLFLLALSMIMVL